MCGHVRAASIGPLSVSWLWISLCWQITPHVDVPLAAVGSMQDMRCNVHTAQWLWMCLWSRHLEKLRGKWSTDYPYNCRRKQGQKYMNGQTDICTHIQGPMALQGRDRALARRVQNQDLVQGLV